MHSSIWARVVLAVGVLGAVGCQQGSLIGTPCVGDEQCRSAEASAAYCIGAESSEEQRRAYRGGYCSVECSEAAGSCPADSRCRAYLSHQGDCRRCSEVCAAPGTGQSTCRDGYLCVGLLDAEAASAVVGTCEPDCRRSSKVCLEGTCGADGYCGAGDYRCHEGTCLPGETLVDGQCALPPGEPPVISNITIPYRTATQVTIRWTTSQPATSRLRYWELVEEVSTVAEGSGVLRTQHQVELHLGPWNRIYFAISVTNSEGITAHRNPAGLAHAPAMPLRHWRHVETGRRWYGVRHPPPFDTTTWVEEPSLGFVIPTSEFRSNNQTIVSITRTATLEQQLYWIGHTIGKLFTHENIGWCPPTEQHDTVKIHGYSSRDYEELRAPDGQVGFHAVYHRYTSDFGLYGSGTDYWNYDGPMYLYREH